MRQQWEVPSFDGDVEDVVFVALSFDALVQEQLCTTNVSNHLQKDVVQGGGPYTFLDRIGSLVKN
jgi:hypothetical protein